MLSAHVRVMSYLSCFVYHLDFPRLSNMSAQFSSQVAQALWVPSSQHDIA